MSLVLIGNGLLLEAKHRTNGFQVYRYINMAIRFQEFSKNTFDPIVVKIFFFRRLTSRRSTSLL